MSALPGVLWNLALFGGTAYIVFGLGHSGWWFLLAFCCMDNLRGTK